MSNYSIDNILKYPFEKIKRISEDGFEYWSARDLSKLLEYTEYRKFLNPINKAKESCKSSGYDVHDHFAHVDDMVEIGSGAEREVENIRLSRFACYLIVQNSDPSKKNVAMGQAYFAVKTRQKELLEEEEQKQLMNLAGPYRKTYRLLTQLRKLKKKNEKDLKINREN